MDVLEVAHPKAEDPKAVVLILPLLGGIFLLRIPC